MVQNSYTQKQQMADQCCEPTGKCDINKCTKQGKYMGTEFPPNSDIGYHFFRCEEHEDRCIKCKQPSGMEIYCVECDPLDTVDFHCKEHEDRCIKYKQPPGMEVYCAEGDAFEKSLKQ